MKLSKISLLLILMALPLSGCGEHQNNNNSSSQEQQGDSTPTDQGIIDDSANYSGDRDGEMENKGTAGLTFAHTTIVSDGQNQTGYMVTGYVGGSANVVIPATFDDVPVLSIDTFAFKDNLVIESLELGKNVIEIKNYAFQHNYNMKKVSIAEGNPYFSLEDGVVYHVEEGKKVMYFGEAGRYYSFDAIEKGITEFRGGCMGNFENLLHLRLNLSQMANLYSRTLSDLFNPDYKSAAYARYYLDRMKNNYVPHLSSVFVEGAEESYNSSIVSNFAYRLYSLTSVEFGEGVKSIGANAFLNCVLLRNIKLTNKITTISDYAFRGCSSLYKIWIPNNPDVKMSLGYDLLRDCTNLSYAGGIFLEGSSSRYTIDNTYTWRASDDGSKYTPKYSQTYEKYLDFNPAIESASIPADPVA